MSSTGCTLPLCREWKPTPLECAQSFLCWLYSLSSFSALSLLTTVCSQQHRHFNKMACLYSLLFYYLTLRQRVISTDLRKRPRLSYLHYSSFQSLVSFAQNSLELIIIPFRSSLCFLLCSYNKHKRRHTSVMFNGPPVIGAEYSYWCQVSGMWALVIVFVNSLQEKNTLEEIQD